MKREIKMNFQFTLHILLSPLIFVLFLSRSELKRVHTKYYKLIQVKKKKIKIK